MKYKKTSINPHSCIKVTKGTKISLNQPYNISSFETSPSLWQKTIRSIGYDLNVNYKIDFRQSIADSWPKKINDSILRNDIKWAPKFGDFDTAKNILRHNKTFPIEKKLTPIKEILTLIN